MGKDSRIEWCDHTFNCWWGCVHVSSGCTHCYAESNAKRWGYDIWGNKPRRLFGEKHWNEPRRWNTKARKADKRDLVFCGSMCDIFEIHPDLEYNEVVLDAERQKLWNLIEETPSLIWMLLTKRPENMIEMAPWDQWPENVWALATAENQERANIVIPELLKVPATVRGLSCEPLLGPIDLRNQGLALIEWTQNITKQLAWLIVGGESGSGARPMHPQWARDIRDQCQAAGIPYFFKQHGTWLGMDQVDHVLLPGQTWADITPHLGPPREFIFEDGTICVHVGKKFAGHLLDGKEWRQFPDE